MTFRIQKSWRWLVAAGAVFVPGIVSGALALPFTCSSGTAIKAADVNANFEALRSRLDAITTPGSALPPVIGTITMNGVLSAVPIRKFTQSVTVNTDVTGTATSAPVLSSIEISRDLGVSSGALINAYTLDKPQTVSIVMGNLTIKLGSAFILDVKIAPALAGHPQEVMALTFGTIEWDYTPPGKPTFSVTYDRVQRSGGANPRTSIKYGAPAPGTTLAAGLIPITGYTQNMTCGVLPTSGGGCGAKLTYGPVSVQKPMGQEVTDDFGRAVSGGGYPMVELQVFNDATTLNNDLRLTNATLVGLTLSSNDDGSLSESLNFQWLKAEWLFGTTSVAVDRTAL